MAKKIETGIIYGLAKNYKDMGVLDIDLRTLSDKKLTVDKKFRRKILRKLNDLSTFKDYVSVKLEDPKLFKSVSERADVKQSKKSKSTVYYDPNIYAKTYSSTTKQTSNRIIGKRLIDPDATITTSREVNILNRDGSLSKDYQTSVSLPLDFDSATDIYSFLDVYRQAEERGELKGKAFRASLFGNSTKSTFNSIGDMIETLEHYPVFRDQLHNTDEKLFDMFVKEFELIEYSNYSEGYNAAKLEAQAKDMQSRKIQKVKKRNAK